MLRMLGPALGLLLVGGGHGVLADGHRALVDELYLASGLDEQIVGVAGQVREGFANGGSGQSAPIELGADVRRRMEAAIDEAFAPQRMRSVVLAELEAELEASDIEAVLVWLRSPLGRRLTQMEEAASTPEAYALMQVYARDIAADPPPRARLARIEGLMRATDALEVAVSTALGSQMAVVTALVGAMPGATEEALGHAVREIERMRPAFTRVVQQQVIVAFLYTYRDASDEDIDRYAEFARSVEGTRYHDAVFSALDRAMVSASKRLGKGIAAGLREQSACADSVQSPTFLRRCGSVSG